MSDFYQDSFTGSADTLLSAHSPDVGSAYDNSGGGDPKLDGSGRAKAGTVQGICWQSSTPPAADYSLEAVVNHLDLQTDQNWHLIARGDPATGDRYALVFNAFLGPGYTLTLSKSVGGAATTLDAVSFTPTPGTPYTFKLTVEGSTITAFRDGVSILTASDSSLAAAGKVALVLQGANGSGTGLRFSAVHAFVPDAEITLDSASVPASGKQINLTFSASISPSVGDFVAASGGVNVPIRSVGGSGASRSLVLPPLAWIGAGDTVKVSYLGEDATHATVTATNSSAVTNRVRTMMSRGYGAFLHFSSATWGFNGALSAPQIAQITPTSVDIDQWLDEVVIPSGARYAIFTTKHDGAWCWWPTASGAPHYSVDLVKQFTDKCRARGLGVGLYINTYDPYYKDQRPGNDGTYGPPNTFTSYMVQQITELLSNYGKIDYLWIDSAAYWPGYTNFVWATVVAAITALQPDCVYTSNDGTYYSPITDHSQVAQYELLGIGEPPEDNTYPADACTTTRADDFWTWKADGEDDYKDVYEMALNVVKLNSRNSLFTLNFAPNTDGLMPASTIAYAVLLGSIIGRQGGTVLPIPGDVRRGVDRGDGFIGTAETGINGTGILGML